MHFIDQLLSRKEFDNQPPVLVDIGASGAIHFRWKKLAPYAICIAFDPDDREYGYIVTENKNYKKLYVFNCIVGDQTREAQPFYLTRSPYCSSFLKPRADKLAPYAFAEKFKVEKETRMPVKSLPDVLAELNISYVDWFKTDSQGMDLRIFKSLSPEVTGGIKAAEFEPGIMDAYQGEDKLHQVLAFMDQQPFFLSHFKVKGSARLSPESIRELASGSFSQKMLAASHRQTAGWGELLYLNNFDNGEPTVRDYLLGAAIALVNEEYGFALEIGLRARKQYKEPIFEDLQRYAKKQIKRTVLKMRFMQDVRKRLLKES